MRLIGQQADEHAGKHRLAFEKQQRRAEQRARQKPVLPSEKVPHRKWRGQHQRDHRQPSHDQIDDDNQAEQRGDVPGDEPIRVGKHRERRQDQKECRRIGPIGVEIISRPDQPRLDLCELRRVVQHGRVCVQRLGRSCPGAREIGIDRHSRAVYEPSSRPVHGDQERSVDRGNGVAVRVQPPVRKDPERGREFSVDFRWIGK